MVQILGVCALLLGVPGFLWVVDAARPQKTGVMRAGVQTVFSPLVRFVGWVTDGMSDGLEWVVTSGQVREHNQILERQIAQLRAENRFLREALSKYDRLGAAALLAETQGWKVVQADVIAYGDRRLSRSLLVNRGASHGVEEGDPVLDMHGLVGTVVRVNPWTSTVQQLDDSRAAVGVVLLPGRTHGIVTGLGRSNGLEVMPQSPDALLEPGQVVATSGMTNSIYPRGLLVGTVERLTTNRFGQKIGLVRPAVGFGRIEEVLILKAHPSGQGNEEPAPTVAAPEASTPTLRLAPALDAGEDLAPAEADAEPRGGILEEALERLP